MQSYVELRAQAQDNIDLVQESINTHEESMEVHTDPYQADAPAGPAGAAATPPQMQLAAMLSSMQTQMAQMV